MKKYAMETSVGVFFLVGLLLIGIMTVKLGHVSIFGEKTYPLSAGFTSVTGLRVGSPVYMFGIEVGRVERLTMDQKNRKAAVELQIEKGIKVYDDAIATIKTEGLIGDKNLRIDPRGTGEHAKPGISITETQADLDLGEIIGKYAFGDVKR